LFAHWLLLLCEFLGHHRDLARFSAGRLLREPLICPRNPHGPGEIINSALGVKIRSNVAGLWLYLRSRHLKPHS